MPAEILLEFKKPGRSLLCQVGPAPIMQKSYPLSFKNLKEMG
jgi:hypothetical protein